IPWGIIFAVTMYFALKVEKVKKDNDIQTYKEIVAFSEGKRLDEIQKQREIGKRPYQKVLLVLGSAAVALAVCGLIGLLMHVFLN
ncbi:MAG: transcriptional regulator, partial [Lachnospiraceae bacterium]|nr:transcriptional regulator [Lachnospiraceae bacterium]